MTGDWDESSAVEPDAPNAAGDADIELLDSIEEQLDDVERVLGRLDQDGT